MNKVYKNVDPACITDCGYQIVVSSLFVQKNYTLSVPVRSDLAFFLTFGIF